MTSKATAIECEICFENFTEETITTHDCRIFCCGACGELLSHKDGKIVMNQGLAEFHHDAEKCSANDEIELLCNMCGDAITDEEAHSFFQPLGEICEKCTNEIKTTKENN